MRKALLSTLPLLIAIVGCNGSTSPSPSSASTTGGAKGTTPSAPTSGLTKLEIKDVTVGKGPAAALGDTVWVSYVGKLMDGTIIDSTERNGGRAYPVTLGAGGVIKGWEQGLIGAKASGKRALRIPYNLAYGDTGRSPNVPAKADLTFDIEVLALVKEGAENNIEARDLKVGTGPVVKKGSKITVKYKVSLVNKVEVDSTEKQGKNVVINVGNGETFPGIDYGVIGMKMGGKRRLFLPPLQGLPMGNETVPPNSPLIVEIEIVDVK